MMWAAAVAGALAWSGPAAAQGAGAGGDQPAPGTGGQQAQGGQGQIDAQLRDALQKLHASNQAEIQLARTAQTKAQSQRVKQFARTMVQEHQKSDRELQQAAQKLGVQLQGDTYQDALQEQRQKGEDMQQLQGAQFDQQFVRQMVDSHKDTLNDVHEAATSAAEQGIPQLAQVLARTETSLHRHHATAQQLQQRLQQQAQRQQGTGAGGAAGTGAAGGAAGTGAAGGTGTGLGGTGAAGTSGAAGTGTTGTTGQQQ